MKKRLITIFIHGTLPPAGVMKLPVLKNFFWCPKGLSKVSEITQNFHIVELARLLCEQDSEIFDKNFFYLFGWSGSLRVKERKKAALTLHNEISTLVKNYKEEGIDVSLRVITNSHGGNVALHLAEISSENSFSIEELILIACPVQKETASSITHPLFKWIISAHSHLDVIQRIDPQGIHNFLKSVHTHGLEFTVTHLSNVGPLFSARHFNPSPNLTQIHVKYPSRELLHIEFILQDYMSSLPAFIRFIETLPKETSSQEELLYIIPPQKKD